MKKKYLFLLSFISGILLWLGWPTIGFAPILLVAFVPILFVEDFLSKVEHKLHWINFFFFSYLTFLTWNIFTTWWIYYSTAFGAIAAIVLNSLFMSIVFTTFHFTKNKLGNRSGYTAFVFFWIAFEYLHMEWELSWPWLTLGNGFASFYKIVQWYEFTGVYGGSLWIMVSNVLFFLILKKLLIEKKKIIKLAKIIIVTSVVVAVPIIISLLIYNNYEEKGKQAKIVIVQPNIDPYNEKFGGMSYNDQIRKLLELASTQVDSTTDFLVAPETALSEGIWENKLDSSSSLVFLKGYLRKYPKLNMLVGLSSFKEYGFGEKISSNAREFADAKGKFYDAYNSAIFIDYAGNNFLYHKSKLVIGVEKIPFPSLFKPLEKFAISLGGTTGSLGTQDERTVFKSLDDNFKIAPCICYESIYGQFMSQYSANGANLMFIITNDGWWENTEGHKQHCNYARLRAIENRRSIARSANTGTSCFINQRGDMSQNTDWWTPAVIKQNIFANNEITFYAQYGDYIAKSSAYLSCLILILLIFKSITNKLSFKFKI